MPGDDIQFDFEDKEKVTLCIFYPPPLGTCRTEIGDTSQQ